MMKKVGGRNDDRSVVTKGVVEERVGYNGSEG